MIKIDHPIDINCGKCDTTNTVSPSELEPPESDSDNRSMGIETEYEWQHELNCKKCKQKISLTIRAFEYPSGFLNYQDHDCKGGTLVTYPHITIDIE